MFYEKTVNSFLNSEQKIIYIEKIVNNFLNNAEQKIILCKILEIVYAEKQWTIFMRKQWIVLINAENRFYEPLGSFNFVIGSNKALGSFDHGL